MFLHWWCLCTCCVSHSTLLTQLKPETSSFAFVCHELDHKRQFFHAHFFQFIILITYSVGKSPKKSHFAILRSERAITLIFEFSLWNWPMQYFSVFLWMSDFSPTIFSHVSIAKSIGQQLLLKSVPDFWWKGRWKKNAATRMMDLEMRKTTLEVNWIISHSS